MLRRSERVRDVSAAADTGSYKKSLPKGNRRPTYKPKTQEGVTDFQSLLKGTSQSNNPTGQLVGVPKELEAKKDTTDKKKDDNVNGNIVTNGLELSTQPGQGVFLHQELAPDFRDPEFNVFVPRDYSGKDTGGLIIVRFVREYPQQLHGVITVEQFQYTIDTINDLLYESQRLSCCSFLESLVGYLTCTLLYLCKKTRMEKAFERVGRFLYEVNDEIYHPVGLHVVHPICRGLRTIVIRSIASYPLYMQDEEFHGKTLRRSN